MDDGQAFGAIQCFFNGLLKETQCWEKDDELSVFRVPLASQGTELLIPYSHYSVSGPHQLTYPLLLTLTDSNTPLSFEKALNLILAEPSIVGNIHDETRELFIQRVLSSLGNTGAALAKRQDELAAIFTQPSSFIAAEQALLLGHNMHPAPKYRSDFDDADFCFAPESGESFSLYWFAVNPERLAGELAGGFYADAVEAILDDLNLALPARPSGYEVLPVHPWQARVLLAHQDIAQLVQDGDLVNLGQVGDGWRATSSLRAIYHPQSRYMLKFSLSVKLTNSIRHLSLKEVKRGLLLDKILASPNGQEFQQRYPNTQIIREPGFMALSLPESGVMEESLLTFRENPFYHSPERQAMVLATLTQAHPFGGDSLVSQLVREYSQQHGISGSKAAEIWFQAYLEQVLEPLLVARCQYGLIFLAHQQNIVVDIKDNLPAGLFYRDCQGTGLTCAAKECFPNELGDETPENFMPHEYVNPFISYYLIFNSSFSLVSALASSGLVTEQSLLSQMQRYLIRLSQRPWRDGSFIDYLLASDELIFKGNFFVYLSNINENSIEDPSKIYNKIANPLYLKASTPPLVKKLSDGTLFCISGRETLTLGWADNNLTLNVVEGQTTKELVCDFQSAPEVNTLRLSRLQLLSVIEHLMFSEGNSAVTMATQVWQRLTGTRLPAWVQVSENQAYFTVAQFEQNPELWLLTDNNHSPQIYTESAEVYEPSRQVQHPIRNQSPQGICYRRYSYSLGQEISFRSVCPESDLNLVHQWMNQARVAEFWELDKPLEELETYLTNLHHDPHQYAIIAEIDGEAFGYFELYWAKEDRLGPFYEAGDYDRGIHLLIGNPDYLGSRFWQVWGRYLTQYCFLENNLTQAVVGEPRVDNMAMVRIWEYFGFKQLKTFHFPHKHAALVYGNRQDFFNTLASRVKGAN